MSALRDFLRDEVVDDLVKNSIEIGNVYYIPMDESNGVTPKDGYDSRMKYFIVLGFDEFGNIYGGVIINTKINTNIPINLRDFHMPILCANNSFLDHNSFVNCAEIKTVSLNKIQQHTCVGAINPDDLELIIATLRDCPTIDNARLMSFGLF